MYKQIYNPETGRKVNVKGRLGRKILSKYLNVLTGGSRTVSHATLTKGSLEDIENITIHIKKPDGADLITGIILSVNSTISHIKELVAEKIEGKTSSDIQLIYKGFLVPSEYDSEPLRKLGIIIPGSVFFYSIKLKSLKQLTEEKKQSEEEEKQRETKEDSKARKEWEEAVEDADGWGLSDDEDML